MHQKILKILKETKDYVSGEQLGEQLGVSRAAIWKAIQKLKEEGYQIEAVSNKGYYLSSSEDLYNGVEIQEALTTKVFGKEIFFYEQTDSTNIRIRELAKQGKKEGVLAVAEMQTAGKGRRGKTWRTLRGTGIWMSLLLCPNMTPPETPLLTLLAGLAVCQAIREQTGLSADIKWPNDILIRGKKVCGILTELDAEMDKVNFVVMGIGINVNTECFSEELKQAATSLKLEKGESISRKKLLCAVLKQFETIYYQYEKEGSFLPFLSRYKKYCINVGRPVQVFSKNPFQGICVDITPEGELIVEKENGERVTVFSGEVSIRNL